MVALGKLLVVAGLCAITLGLLLWVSGSIPLLSRLGRLPGDIYVRNGNFSIYFPLTTSIIVSIVISLLIALLRR